MSLFFFKIRFGSDKELNILNVIDRYNEKKREEGRERGRKRPREREKR